MHNLGVPLKTKGPNGTSNSYAHVVKGSQSHNLDSENIPAMMLDDSCLNQQNFNCCLMGKVQNFESLSNLKVVLVNEGFDNIDLKYMGGYWIQQASTDFFVEGRVAWVDIEGVPLKMWSDNTFKRIASKWGTLIHEPDFMEDNDDDSNNDDDLINDLKKDEELEGDSDTKAVPDIIFDDASIHINAENASVEKQKTHSEDPFNIYKLLTKNKENNHKEFNLEDSSKYPPGNKMENIDSLSIREILGKSLLISSHCSCWKLGWDFMCLGPKSLSKLNATISDYFVMHSSFIALILKTLDANMVKDFRPISLIVSMYKIIAKILANLLVLVLGDLVNEVQSTFIVDRQILDGPFILNEIVQWCQSKKKQYLVFKVDFEKAFDSVRWDYLDNILRSPTEEFQFHKGLKQGDLLSPFLFILVMETLHISFQRIVDAGMFKGIMLSPSLQLSHLFYADDVIFMGQWNESNLDTIVQVLECFHRASGLRLNMSKSKLMGIYVDADKVAQAARKIGCVTLKTPFTYLGSKVGGHMSRIQSWNETIEAMASRLSKWKMKTLSIGGRLTLLKSVLGSMPIYHMSIFKVPMKILQRMESIRSYFFNGSDPLAKKPTWVKWTNVLASKEKGGLGISSLYALNRALMFKWVWRFLSQNSSLWANVIKSIHGDHEKIGKQVKVSYPSIWLDIVKEVDLLKKRGLTQIR
ncbi:RNA-directed DNA polymerase, eukaryota [Tanacetum coccineum]